MNSDRSDVDNDVRRDEILKRMLKTPPKPHGGKKLVTESGQKKPDGTPAKKRRPGKNQ